MGRVCKEGSGTIWLEKRGCVRSREMARANKAKTANPASRDNGIKTDFVAVVVIVVVSKPLSKPSYYFFLQLCIKDFFSLSRSSSEMRKKCLIMPYWNRYRKYEIV